MKKNRTPNIGEFWSAFLPWQGVGNELRYSKSVYKSPIRKVLVISHQRLSALQRTLIIPTSSSKYSPEALAIGFDGAEKGKLRRVKGGTLRGNHIQGFPISFEKSTICEGGCLFKKGQSPFEKYKDTWNSDELEKLMKQINAFFFSSEQLNDENLLFYSGDVVNVLFSNDIYRPAIAIRCHNNNRLITVLQAIKGYKPKYERAEGFFIVKPEENIRDTYITIGLSLLRTIDIKRCDPCKLGQLSKERYFEMVESFKGLCFKG